MGLLKNTAGQRWRVFAFNRTTNAPVTGDAANITAKIRLDWGTATATDDTNPTEVEDGYYDFVLTQAESNANWLDLFPESSTDDVQVIGVPGGMATNDVNAIADAVLSRNVSNVEATMPEHCLGTVVLAMLENDLAATPGSLLIYRTDGTTVHVTKTVTSDPSADPLVKVE